MGSLEPSRDRKQTSVREDNDNANTVGCECERTEPVYRVLYALSFAFGVSGPTPTLRTVATPPAIRIQGHLAFLHGGLVGGQYLPTVIRTCTPSRYPLETKSLHNLSTNLISPTTVGVPYRCSGFYASGVLTAAVLLQRITNSTQWQQ